MIVTIDGINRKMITTKYGERESIGIVPLEERVTDINGDEFALDGRWINGFKDKKSETDKWDKGVKVKIQIELKKYTRQDGSEAEAVNFRLPEGQSSIVEEAKVETEAPVSAATADEPDDF